MHLGDERRRERRRTVKRGGVVFSGEWRRFVASQNRMAVRDCVKGQRERPNRIRGRKALRKQDAPRRVGGVDMETQGES